MALTVQTRSARLRADVRYATGAAYRPIVRSVFKWLYVANSFKGYLNLLWKIGTCYSKVPMFIILKAKQVDAYRSNDD